MTVEEAVEFMGELRSVYKNTPNNDATDRVWYQAVLREMAQAFAFEVLNAMATELEQHLIPSVPAFNAQRRKLQGVSVGVPPEYKPLQDAWLPDKSKGHEYIAEARRLLRKESA